MPLTQATHSPTVQIAVVGGGPAGLRAAEVAAASGALVALFDAQSSMGRKLLVAGSSGLNLTRAESRERLLPRYTGPGMAPELWPSLLEQFDADALRAWAAGLGIDTFVAGSGRVYPVELKAARLLRRWMDRLRAMGVTFHPGHRWTGLQRAPSHDRLRLDFATLHAGPVSVEAEAVVLALGGGSWPRTGSDGAWVPTLEKLGVGVTALEPANCGWETDWSAPFLAQAEGKPLKNIVVTVGERQAPGELLVTRYGLEGGALYAMGAALRAVWRRQGSAELCIDLKPAFSAQQLLTKLGALGNTPRDLLGEARTRWRLSEAANALLETRAPHVTPAALAAHTKAFRLTLTGPRPLAEAISSAGGVQWADLTPALMLRLHPGVFVAGEMIDWEAPTGGYLIQGCMATGTRAGLSARDWWATQKNSLMIHGATAIRDGRSPGSCACGLDEQRCRETEQRQQGLEGQLASPVLTLSSSAFFASPLCS